MNLPTDKVYNLEGIRCLSAGNVLLEIPR